MGWSTVSWTNKHRTTADGQATACRTTARVVPTFPPHRISQAICVLGRTTARAAPTFPIVEPGRLTIEYRDRRSRERVTRAGRTTARGQRMAARETSLALQPDNGWAGRPQRSSLHFHASNLGQTIKICTGLDDPKGRPYI
jgi:hypothetical protein